MPTGSLHQGMIERHPGTHDHFSAVVSKSGINVTESGAVHIDISYRRRIVSQRAIFSRLISDADT